MDNSQETESPNASAQTLAERINIVNAATSGLYQATLSVLAKAEDKEEIPAEFSTLLKGALSDALTLANCGLIALTEIADAQQRMAIILAEEKAIIERAEANEKSTKRGFIGQKSENSG